MHNIWFLSLLMNIFCIYYIELTKMIRKSFSIITLIHVWVYCYLKRPLNFESVWMWRKCTYYVWFQIFCKTNLTWLRLHELLSSIGSNYKMNFTDMPVKYTYLYNISIHCKLKNLFNSHFWSNFYQRYDTHSLTASMAYIRLSSVSISPRNDTTLIEFISRLSWTII